MNKDCFNNSLVTGVKGVQYVYQKLFEENKIKLAELQGVMKC